MVNAGDTAWVMMSTALVLLMVPGLALFYGGMVRRKNLIATVMQSFIIMGIVHGLTNLGGPLLTMIVYAKDYEKRKIRSTIAASYATFATFQIVTLLVSGFDIDIKLSMILLSLTVGIAIFIATEKMIFTYINAETYRNLFSGFIFLSGLLLIVKSVY